MRPTFSALLLSFLFTLAGLAYGQQVPPPLVIDSFKAGEYSSGPLTNYRGSATQPGDEKELLGGSRRVNLAIAGDDGQPASVQVLTTKPALIVSAGFHVFPGLTLGYKVPPASENLMARYDRFLIDFDGLDQELDLSITVYDAYSQSHPYTSEVCKLASFHGPFTLSFAFSRFRAPSPGVKQATNIAFIFTVTNRGGVDYAITRITSAKADPVGRRVVTCLH